MCPRPVPTSVCVVDQVTGALSSFVAEEGQRSEAVVRVLKQEIDDMAREGGLTAQKVGKDMCATLGSRMEQVPSTRGGGISSCPKHVSSCHVVLCVWQLVVRLMQQQSRDVLSKVHAYQVRRTSLYIIYLYNRSNSRQLNCPGSLGRLPSLFLFVRVGGV